MTINHAAPITGVAVQSPVLLYPWGPQVNGCANTSRALEGPAAAVGGAV